MHQTLRRTCSALLACLIPLALYACGGGRSGTIPGGDAPLPESDAVDSGQLRLPGDPELIDGLSNAPGPLPQYPSSKAGAQAGVDFASNRFIVIFENAPQQPALAPFLGGGSNGTGTDAVLSRDNAPLVQHPYFRQVSRNMASRYGLTTFGRVFYKDVNFACYEIPGISDISQLNAMMRRVLTENRGLVREVCYDVYHEPVTMLDGQGFRELTPEELNNVMPVGAGGFKPRTAQDAVKCVSAPPDDPMHINRSGNGGGTWCNWRVGAVDGDAWDHCTGGTDVLIAVIDTGIRMTHQDLSANVITPSTTAPFNAPGVLTDVVAKDNDPNDGHGHGTNCAGCVGARGNNSVGLSGMNQIARILPIRVFNNSGGGGTDAVIAEAILLADYLGVNILSLSLRGLFTDRTTQLAIEQATGDGCLVVVAAGNDNMSTPAYPAYFNDAFAIGGTTLNNSSDNADFNGGGDLTGLDRFDGRVSFSNYGDWVDIAAPGTEVRTTSRASDSAYTAAISGTSFSCPYAAGCAGLLWQYIINEGGAPTNEMVRGLLLSSATEMGLSNGANPRGFINNSSNGTVRFINIGNAMDLFDSGGSAAPVITWDNPLDDESVSGLEELRVSVDAPESTIHKVQFETRTRVLGTVTMPDAGFYKLDWDSSFEFNREMELTVKAYDDMGNIASSTITITPDNAHAIPAWSEAFDGLAADALPAGWTKLNGNQGTSDTSWGGDTGTGGVAAPSVKSTGSSTTFAGDSNDWLFAPILDMRNHANTQFSFKTKYTMPPGFNPDCLLIATPDDYTYYYLDEFANGTVAAFTDKTYDFSFFAGREIRVFWAFFYAGGSQTGGVWVDDVAASGSAESAPTIVIDSPMGGDTVAGLVPIEVTVSDDTDDLRLEVVPPVLGFLTFEDIPDNDLINPTKTFTLDWDSRHVYNGAAFVTVYALKDIEDDDTPDLIASASVALNVSNPTRDPAHFDGFEAITELGGLDGGNLDGDWFTWTGGTSQWRINATDPHSGDQLAKMGPTGGGNYGSNEFDLLFSPVHDLSTANFPLLRFFHKLDVENSGSGDIAKVFLLRYNGVDETLIPLAEFRNDTSPAGDWIESTYDLTQWQGTSARILFQFTSDGDANVGAGWFIDDYEVVDAEPQINSIVDPSGVPGKAVTVNGLRFGSVQGAGTVTFQKSGGGTVAAAINSWSNTAISVDVPANAVSGDVIVTTFGQASNGHYFGVSLGAPTLDDLGQL